MSRGLKSAAGFRVAMSRAIANRKICDVVSWIRLATSLASRFSTAIMSCRTSDAVPSLMDLWPYAGNTSASMRRIVVSACHGDLPTNHHFHHSRATFSKLFSASRCRASTSSCLASPRPYAPPSDRYRLQVLSAPRSAVRALLSDLQGDTPQAPSSFPCRQRDTASARVWHRTVG